MAVRGITFSKQTVSSNDDSQIFKVLLNGRKGRIKGCEMTFGTDDIYISDGYFFIINRLVEVASMETVSTPVVATGTTYCRLVFEADLTQTNTPTAFEQGSFKILTSTTDYPELTQEDVESGGYVYQLPFARFVKTIEGISSFVSELETIGIAQGNETIYVSTSGNDASGDGSESYPFKTIQHALDTLPKDLGNRDITINVASGTYAEDIVASGFYGGTLRFAFGTVTINTISVYESCIILAGTALTLSAGGKTYGFYCHRGSNVICQIPITINGSTNGVYALFGSRFAANREVTVNSCTYAVVSMYAAQIYISSLAGSKNNNGVQASAGIASIGSVAAGLATTVYLTSAGGRIYTGAQASVPSY